MSGTNGTAVRNRFVGLGLRFSEFRSQLRTGPLHEGITVPTAFQNAGFDPAGPVGHFVGRDVGQHQVVHRTGIVA